MEVLEWYLTYLLKQYLRKVIRTYYGEKTHRVACRLQYNLVNYKKELCPALYGLLDYTVHGIFQGRILEWVAFPFSRGSSQPRDWTQVSLIAGKFFNSWATREAQEYCSG